MGSAVPRVIQATPPGQRQLKYKNKNSEIANISTNKYMFFPLYKDEHFLSKKIYYGHRFNSKFLMHYNHKKNNH